MIRRFRSDLSRRMAKWVVVVGMLWCGWVVYVYASTDLWWHVAK